MTAIPRKLPRQARSQATVSVILDATAHILTTHPPEEFNTNVIARKAGVSVGSIYQYFPNKEALLRALHDRHSTEMADAIELVGAATGGADLHTDLRRLIRAAFAAHEADPALHKMLDQHVTLTRADHPGGERIHQMVGTLLDRHRDEITHGDLARVTWMTMRMTEALVHAAVLDQPPEFASPTVEEDIVVALHSFLTAQVPG
ncbi:TetR/AcrR family transcriptional regulator [Sphingopyxis fribergensis]